MAKQKGPSDEISQLLAVLDEAFQRRSWHGTNLRGSIRGLSAAEATRRAPASCHNVAEIVVHCAYWKYTVRRRLLDQPRGGFPLKGSDWFTLADPLEDKEWKHYVRILTDEHKQLHEAVAACDAKRLRVVPTGSKLAFEALIRGIAMHDVYHAGQIQLIKQAS